MAFVAVAPANKSAATAERPWPIVPDPDLASAALAAYYRALGCIPSLSYLKPSIPPSIVACSPNILLLLLGLFGSVLGKGDDLSRAWNNRHERQRQALSTPGHRQGRYAVHALPSDNTSVRPATQPRPQNGEQLLADIHCQPFNWELIPRTPNASSLRHPPP